MKSTPCSLDAREPTLWDLAEIVLEETEKCCVREDLVQRVTDQVVASLIQKHVKNMTIEMPHPLENALSRP